MNGALAPEAILAGSPTVQSQTSQMSLLQANLLVAMLAGFWARAADGHPGPDLMGRGLIILNILVEWERRRKERAGKDPPTRGARKSG